MTAFRDVTACRLCDSADLSEVLNLGETPLANELWTPEQVRGAQPGYDSHSGQVEDAGYAQETFPLVVNRCGSCGHHQLSIAVSPERLWGPSYPYQSGTSPVFRAHLEKLADELMYLAGACSRVQALRPCRSLDIGANDGTFVKLMANHHFDAIGIDPSAPDGVEGLFKASWPCVIGAPASPFDVITALNVFAHVDDLHSFTAAVKEALAPDGVFIVEVGYIFNPHKPIWDTVYHEHFSYHTLTALWPFFMRHGLAIDCISINPSQGETLRLYVKHQSNAKAPGANSWTEGAAPLEAYRSLIDSRAAALRTALNTLFHRGEMVCIYGAPAKLTTLLYATGLEKMPFNCVGDDNPRKVGRTTPGNHIPIVSVEDMLARKPDTILVASWNFFDDIRRKLRDAGFKGGIINPMGEL